MMLGAKALQAIKRIQYITKFDKKIYLAFSGGKDSIVIYHLAKRSGITFTAAYQNTTIDPPGTYSYIKKNFPDVIVQQPNESFFKGVEKAGLPTRRRRWCCDKLKKGNNESDSITIVGVRRAESYGRSTRKLYDVYKGLTSFNAIIDWTDEDVWSYITEHGIPVIKYYKSPYNYKRHGCIACPLQSKKGQLQDIKTFPNYTKSLIKAVRLFDETHDNHITKYYGNIYNYILIWIRQEPKDLGLYKINNDMFKEPSEKIIYKLLEQKNGKRQ